MAALRRHLATYFQKPQAERAYARKIKEVKEFLLVSRRKNTSSVEIKKSTRMTTFKLRCSKYLYTLCITDGEKADKLRRSLPPGLEVKESAAGRVPEAPLSMPSYV